MFASDTFASRGWAATPLLIASLALPSFAMQSGPGGTGNTVPPFVGGAPFIEAWVDPCLGSDLTAQVGCPDLPFLTLNAAIGAVSGGASAATPGLVHANPGIYSAATNGEVLPINILNFVDVQGAGAKRTVIRGDGTPNSNIFLPRGSDDCICGARLVPQEVLVELGSTFTFGYYEMFDGFTLQGGDVQVHIEGEATGDVTISNCVFDMLDMSPDVGVPGPTFGIEMVHTYDPSFPEGYLDLPLNILNNTFIMGWAITEEIQITSLPEAVAIVDVTDPLCGFPFPDPNPQLRGVGNPNIQNNLIRYSCDNARTPLLGIDATDTSALVGGAGVPSNAFDPTLPGGFDLTFTWCSTILGAVPVPAVNPQPATGGVDPGFVGEMLTNFAGAIFPFTVGRDWRLLPDSVLVDQGVAPAAGVLTAVNGTAYTDPPLIPRSSFDFDGEHYGNLRIEGEAPDIGFDETGLMINAGGYGNDTRNYGISNNADCPAIPGLLGRVIITPTTGTLSVCEDRSPFGGFIGFACGGTAEAFSAQFGSLVLPVPFGGTQFLWIQTTPLPPLVFSCPVLDDPLIPLNGYIPPCGNVPHNFAFTLAAGTPINDLGEYVVEQGIFTPTGGQPVLTNMQATFD